MPHGAALARFFFSRVTENLMGVFSFSDIHLWTWDSPCFASSWKIRKRCCRIISSDLVGLNISWPCESHLRCVVRKTCFNYLYQLLDFQLFSINYDENRYSICILYTLGTFWEKNLGYHSCFQSFNLMWKRITTYGGMKTDKSDARLWWQSV